MQQESFPLPPGEMLTRSEDTEQRQQEAQQPAEESRWQKEAIQRCLAGDEGAFALIAEQYGNLLLRTAYLLVRDEELAKDIVQESLLLAWKNLKQLREPGFLRAWLLKIVVNQSMSFKRQIVRKAMLLSEQISQYALNLSMQQADRERGSIEENVDIEQALSLLPANQRIVIILFYYQRMTMPEISSCLGVSENTLRKRLLAALDKMRRALHIEEVSEEGYRFTAIEPHISMRRGGAQ